MKREIICIAALALGSCASDAVRPVASGTMKLSQGLQAELTAFGGRQNEEMEARRSAIKALNENTNASTFIATEQVMDWRASDNETALRLYEQASTLPIGTQLAGQTTSALLAPAEPSNSVNFDPKNYDALVKTLKPLADKRSTFKDVSFLFSYGQAIVDAMKDDVAQTEQPDTGADKPGKVESGNEE
jgi:hypothetical protein